MPVVMIFRMHSSGTSMVARLLDLTGLYFGAEAAPSCKPCYSEVN